MSYKLNCWEFKNCGREIGGVLSDSRGVCPVASNMKLDGTNGGRAGGRVCWKIPVSASDGRALKTCADKPCHICAFYLRVKYEENQQPDPTRKLTIITRSVETKEPVRQD